MNADTWERIRKSADDSKYYKESVHGIWGREKLKERVGFKQTEGKLVATPYKVKVAEGALQTAVLNVMSLISYNCL